MWLLLCELYVCVVLLFVLCMVGYMVEILCGGLMVVLIG